LIGAGIVFLAALAGLALLALSLRDALRKRKEAANASEEQSS
jgi:type III secretion protein J